MDERLRELKQSLQAAEKEREQVMAEIDRRQAALSSEYMLRLHQYAEVYEADKRVSDEMLAASRYLDKLEMKYLMNEEKIEQLRSQIAQYSQNPKP